MGSTSKRFKGGRKWPHTGLVSWRHMNIGGGLDSYVLMMYGLYYHFNRLSPSPLSLPSLPPLSPFLCKSLRIECAHRLNEAESKITSFEVVSNKFLVLIRQLDSIKVFWA